MKKIMYKKEFIDIYILPNESHNTIVEYMQGSIDFDDEFLNEVAQENDVKII